MSEFFPWTRELRQQNHAKTIKCQFATESKQKNSVKNDHENLNAQTKPTLGCHLDETLQAVCIFCM